MGNTRTINVFIASPGDLAVERRAFRDAVDELNAGFGDGADVEFQALGWEDTLASTGRRSQAVINADIDRADVFILTMHVRWGQDAPDSEYSSYTEEEFHRALDRFKKTGAPEIFVILKHIPAMMMADPGEQLKKVLAFRRELEESRQVLYRQYETPEQFSLEVNNHLRAYAKGELPSPGDPADATIFPVEFREQMEQLEREREQAAERADKLALTLAEQAAEAALNGRIEQARQTFAQATEGTNLWRILVLSYQFYLRTGDLAAAEAMMQRALAIDGEQAETETTAKAVGNLGLIYMTQGELDEAEKMHRRSLEIEEKLGRQEGMAIQYGNLGLIYRTRGELNEAEKLHRRGLEIDEELDNQEGISRHTGNLGAIYGKRGELDRAEQMLRRSLEIDEKLDRQESMANNYGDLGLIYQERGELAEAEEMHRRALVIDEKLGRQEGMARQYGNLGLIYQERGELDEAEKMLRRSLEIEEKLGLQEGMANQYGNLGFVAKERGELAEARQLWTTACDLFAKIGMKPEEETVKSLLESIGGSEGREKGGEG